MSTVQQIEMCIDRLETLQIGLLQDDDPTLGIMLGPALDILRNVEQMARNIDGRSEGSEPTA